MRVVQLGVYPPPHGGVQTHIAALHQFLRRRDIECFGINMNRFRKKDTEEIFYPKTALQVLGVLFRLRSDVIHLHVGGHLSRKLLWLGLVCGLWPRSRAVLTFHSGGFPSSRAGQQAHTRSFSGFVLRRFDRVIGVNREIIDWFKQIGCPEQNISLIQPHIVEQADHDAALPPNIEEFYRSSSPRLLTVGLLEPEYDLPLQIELIGRVCATHPKAGLLIIGSGSQEGELRRLIADSPHARQILLAGDVPHAITLRAIAECDLFVRTTKYDGDSISVREALQAGTPVIATDNGMRPTGVTTVPVANLMELERAALHQLALPRPAHEAPAADLSNLESVLDVYTALVG